MPDEVETFARREELQRDRDELDNLVEVARSRRAQKRFQLRKREFDRIEIRTVGRQKAEARADTLDRGLHLRLPMHRQVVEDNYVTRPQRRHQHLLDIREKCGIVDGAVEHGGRMHAVDT